MRFYSLRIPFFVGIFHNVQHCEKLLIMAVWKCKNDSLILIDEISLKWMKTCSNGWKFWNFRKLLFDVPRSKSTKKIDFVKKCVGIDHRYSDGLCNMKIDTHCEKLHAKLWEWRGMLFSKWGYTFTLPLDINSMVRSCSIHVESRVTKNKVVSL